MANLQRLFPAGSFQESNIAAATTTDLGSTTQVRVNITVGAASIASFGTVANKWRQGRFSTIVTLEDDGVSLILPNNGNDIITEVGATFEAFSDATGKWRVVWYQRPSGFTAASLSFAATQRLAGRNAAGPGAGEELTLSTILNWLTTDIGAIPTSLGGGVWGHISAMAGTASLPLVSSGAGLSSYQQLAAGAYGVNSVGYSKIELVAASRLLGNPTGAPANVSEISLGATLEFNGTLLRTTAITGDVTAPVNSHATTLTDNAVSNAKLRQSAALSLIGRSLNSTGNVADIPATAASDAVLRESGSVLGFGTVATGGLANGAVTLGKMANLAANSFLANNTGAPATPLALTVPQATSLLNVLFVPGGRLTLVSGAPIIAVNTLAATSIFYTFDKHDKVPVYDGTNWVFITFTELMLVLDSDAGHTGYHQSGKIFDLFVVNDAGTIRLVSGPAWTTDFARADAISRLNGIYVNTSSMTARFGSAAGNTITVAAQRGTYVGSFRASANGQTEMSINSSGASGGSNAKLYLWNAYNQVPTRAASIETASSWTYNSTTTRNLNNNTSNRVSLLLGLSGNCSAVMAVSAKLGNIETAQMAVGLGLDSESAMDVMAYFASVGSVQLIPRIMLTIPNRSYVGIFGHHFIQGLELADANVATFYGGATLTRIEVTAMM